MRARALVSAITFGLLLVLMLVIVRGETTMDVMVAHAGYVPAGTNSGGAKLETWENFQPTGWVSSTLVTCVVEVYNPGGFTEEAQYQYRTGGNWSAWTGSGLQVTWLDTTRRRLTVQGLALPHSMTLDQNQIKFRHKSATGGWLESGAYSVLVDASAPTSSIVISTCYHSAMEIKGTASDSGSGVSLVQIQLQRSVDGFYYNGSSWQSAATWMVAAGTTDWSLPFVPSPDVVYNVAARATDSVGHVQSPPSTAVFYYDATPPQSTVTTVGYFKTGTWLGAITGTADDVGSEIAYVQIKLQRSLDGLYYNGSSWEATATFLTASGTTFWSVPFTPAAEAVYTVTSQATDQCGNVETVPDTGIFTYDNTPPGSTVLSTGCFTAWAGAISGTASDNVAGVAKVEITLQRASDGQYYNGSSWQPTASWITATGTTNWSVSFATPAQTTYLVTSRATDNAGHVQSSYGTGSFTYDASPPESTVLTAGYFHTWPGTIQGSASDSFSGVAAVHITIQRASDSLYYDGTAWGPTMSWIAATGTSLWTVPFTPAEETLYTVTSRATDNCGNVQYILGVSTFSYDTTGPLSAITTTGWFNLLRWNGFVEGTATDPSSGIASVQVTLQRGSDGLYYSGSTWGPKVWITATGTNSWSLPFTPTAEGVYTVTSQATDRSGNVQAVPSTAFFGWDVTLPMAPINLTTQPSLWTPVNSFTVTWTNQLDLSGIAKAHYKWDAAPTGNNDQSPGSPVVQDGIQSLLGIAVPAEGTHRLFLWLEDKAGNANFLNPIATDVGAFKWDSTAPTTAVSNVYATQGCSGWFISAVEVSLLAVDVNPDPPRVNATSGVSATFWRKDGSDWQPVVGSSLDISDQGAHVVDVYSVDVAGNVEQPHPISPTIKIDSVAPTTAKPSFTGTLGPNEWYRSAVSVMLTAVDATSGVSVTYHQVNTGTLEAGNSFSVAADGVHTIRYYSVDAACNQEAVYTATLKIDKTPPRTSHQLNGRLGENGWFLASPVTVTLSASDVVTGVQGSSGVAELFYRIDGGSWWQSAVDTVSFTVAVPAGQKEYSRTVEYYATDLAGNAGAVFTFTIGIDFQAPPNLPIAPYSVPSGWTNVNCYTVTWFLNPVDYSGIGGAYYSFQDPISNTAGTLFLGDDLMSIPCVQVPSALGDGLRSVYVWLRDRAGNTDYRTRSLATVALDRDPPRVTATVTGNPCGTSGWYNIPVTVTCVATDTLSGTGVISYQVNGGGWIQGPSYSESRDGHYVVECRAADGAGNPSEVITTLLKIDRVAPEAPTPVWVEPSDWSKDNLFTVRWVNPGDLSGLAGVYYKRGSPPTAPTDGTYVDGVQTSLSISATTEGLVPVHVWLVDKACNLDHQRAATATLKYDRTPPATTFSSAGTLGGNGWYISPVSITLTCVDGGSGCGPDSGRYRIGNGSWRTGNSFSVEADGSTPFSYYSVDLAGNAGSALTGTVNIDRTTPSSYAYSDGCSASPSFTVRWDGNDTASGIDTFDVQYRVGTAEPWQDWVLGVDATQKSKLFTGAAGKCFYFRTRAKDKAGNAEQYPTVADTSVCVELLVNGDFERTLGSEWATAAVCPVTQMYAPSYTGGSTRVVVLGCPDQETDAPFGESMICQTINVPSAQDMPAPRMLFRYHIFTYDVVWGLSTGKLYDSFHAGVSDPGQMSPTYVLTDGNWSEPYGTRHDLGWRQGNVDLRPYAGRTIRVCLANVTRVDRAYNTWTFVDDVRICNLENRITLPIMQRMRLAQASVAAELPKATQPDQKGER